MGLKVDGITIYGWEGLSLPSQYLICPHGRPYETGWGHIPHFLKVEITILIYFVTKVFMCVMNVSPLWVDTEFTGYK